VARAAQRLPEAAARAYYPLDLHLHFHTMALQDITVILAGVEDPPI
jgi:hypothetical protein